MSKKVLITAKFTVELDDNIDMEPHEFGDEWEFDNLDQDTAYQLMNGLDYKVVKSDVVAENV